MPIYWAVEAADETFNIIDAGAAEFGMSVEDFCAMVSAVGWTIAAGIAEFGGGLVAWWNNTVDVAPGALARIVFHFQNHGDIGAKDKTF